MTSAAGSGTALDKSNDSYPPPGLSCFWLCQRVSLAGKPLLESDRGRCRVRSLSGSRPLRAARRPCLTETDPSPNIAFGCARLCTQNIIPCRARQHFTVLAANFTSSLPVDARSRLDNVCVPAKVAGARLPLLHKPPHAVSSRSLYDRHLGLPRCSPAALFLPSLDI